MPETDKDDFLYALYDEKIQSFLYYLEEVKKSYRIENVHQLRVNTKRIDAIYQLIESATATNFNAESHLKPIKDIFKIAGKLREGQVNLELLKTYNVNPDAYLAYSLDIEKLQVKTIRELRKTVKKFDKISFDHTIDMVKAYCKQTEQNELMDKMYEYIQMKARSIQKLLQKKQKPKNVHRIRKRLKAIDPILSLLCNTNYEKFNNNSIESLKESALYIGEWHDRIILLKSINILVENLNGRNRNLKKVFAELSRLIEKDIDKLVEKMKTHLAVTINYIIH